MHVRWLNDSQFIQNNFRISAVDKKNPPSSSTSTRLLLGSSTLIIQTFLLYDKNIYTQTPKK